MRPLPWSIRPLQDAPDLGAGFGVGGFTPKLFCEGFPDCWLARHGGGHGVLFLSSLRCDSGGRALGSAMGRKSDNDLARGAGA